MQPLDRHPTEPAAEITVTGSVIPIRSDPNRMSKLNIPIDSSRRNSDTSHIFPTTVTALRVFHVDHKAVEPCRPSLQRGNRAALDTLLGLCGKGLRVAYQERGVHLGALAPRDGWVPSPGSSAQHLRRCRWAKGHETSTMYLRRPRETRWSGGQVAGQYISQPSRAGGWRLRGSADAPDEHVDKVQCIRARAVTPSRTTSSCELRRQKRSARP